MPGAPGKTRTCYLGFRKALLYPNELRGRGVAVPQQRASDDNYYVMSGFSATMKDTAKADLQAGG